MRHLRPGIPSRPPAHYGRTLPAEWEAGTIPDMPKDNSIKSVLLIGSGPIPDTTLWFRDYRPSPLKSVHHLLSALKNAKGQ